MNSPRSLYPQKIESSHLVRCFPNDLNCSRCRLHTQAQFNRCIAGEGEPGGILFVGEGPGKTEDAHGSPFVGKCGALLRRIVEREAAGPVAFANATGCYPGKYALDDKVAIACRPYLAEEIRKYQPSKIITLGAWAAFSVLNRGVAPFSSRGAYSFVNVENRTIPVVTCIHPSAALRNQFVRMWFEEDLCAAIHRTDFPQLFRGEYIEIESDADAMTAIMELTATRATVSFDVETCGTMFCDGFHILSVALCSDTNRVFVWGKKALCKGLGRDPLCYWFENEAFLKCGHNVKYDCLAVQSGLGVTVRGIAFDTRLARKLLEPEAHASLALCAELIGLGGHKDEAHEKMKVAAAEMTKQIRKGMRSETQSNLFYNTDVVREIAADCIRREADSDRWAFALLPTEILHRYNARDALVTARLRDLFDRQICEHEDLSLVWNELVCPANEAFVQIEAWGFKVSLLAIDAFDAWLQCQIEAYKTQLSAYSTTTNWDSPQQVVELLFGKLGIMPPKMTDTGKASVDSEVLARLREKHPIAGLISDYRHMSKLRSSYGRGMLSYVCSDGRVRPQYLLDGARTGRLSATSPAIQTIPRPATTEGKMARDCFVAEPGYVLLSADYSQIELRIAAFLSDDREMIEIFRADVDYHQRTAEFISQVAWGIEPEQVEKKHRSAAKCTNFGLIYGMFDSTLAKRIGCTIEEASRIRAAVLGKFTKLAEWIEEQKSFARKYGFVRTYWQGKPARRRPLEGVLDADDRTRSHAENGASNTPVQGTAADYALASLIEIVRWIQQDAVDAKVVATVHDSIILEVAERDVPEVAATVREIMCSWYSGDVPLAVDIEIGKSWGSLEPLKQ